MPSKVRRDRTVYSKKWRENLPYEGGYAAYLRNWHKNNPGKRRLYDRKKDKGKKDARAKLNRAISIGKIVRLNCQKCNDVNTQAHHEDYSQPLNVIWFCRKCHLEHHKGH